MFSYPVVSRLLHPYAPLVILLGLAIAWLWWKRRLRRAERLAITVPYLLLVMISLPAVSFLAHASIEWPYPPMDRRPADVEAIVVLSGAVDPPDESRDYAVLGRDTLARCLHAAALYRQGEPCWVIVSGGKVPRDEPGPPAAAAMSDFLITQGVPKDYILLEGRSSTTYENAVESCKLLREHKIGTTMLVTDAFHLPRGVSCFRRQGIEVIPSGCRYRTRKPEWSAATFLPSPSDAKHVSEVWHEWLGLAYYWLTDRV